MKLIVINPSIVVMIADEGDVMMGSSESRSLDVTYYNENSYGSLAEPVESTVYSRCKCST
jgi:hypothetical protein